MEDWAAGSGPSAPQPLEDISHMEGLPLVWWEEATKADREQNTRSTGTLQKQKCHLQTQQGEGLSTPSSTTLYLKAQGYLLIDTLETGPVYNEKEPRGTKEGKFETSSLDSH